MNSTPIKSDSLRLQLVAAVFDAYNGTDISSGIDYWLVFSKTGVVMMYDQTSETWHYAGYFVGKTFIANAKEVHLCNCGGSGIYYGQGSVVNGVFKGYTGQHFRCAGKGFQVSTDVKRNNHYDNNYRSV